jgi:hypothetical protein
MTLYLEDFGQNSYFFSSSQLFFINIGCSYQLHLVPDQKTSDFNRMSIKKASAVKTPFLARFVKKNFFVSIIKRSNLVSVDFSGFPIINSSAD